MIGLTYRKTLENNCRIRADGVAIRSVSKRYQEPDPSALARNKDAADDAFQSALSRVAQHAV